MPARGSLVRVIILGVLGAVYWVGYALSMFAYSDVLAAVIGWGVPIYVAFWARADARSSRYWPAFHYAWYLAGFWPVVLPHYVLRTRGVRGIPLLGLLVLLLTSSLWGYWLGILVGWSVGWYSGDAVHEQWRGVTS